MMETRYSPSGAVIQTTEQVRITAPISDPDVKVVLDITAHVQISANELSQAAY